MEPFVFSGDLQIKAAHVGRVPPGIVTKQGLLDVLYEQLKFPDYFGDNWDALNDCIRDLSWLPIGNVILTHDDLPLAKDEESLKIYLSILKDAVEMWKGDSQRRLTVVFQPGTERLIKSALP